MHNKRQFLSQFLINVLFHILINSYIKNRNIIPIFLTSFLHFSFRFLIFEGEAIYKDYSLVFEYVCFVTSFGLGLFTGGWDHPGKLAFLYVLFYLIETADAFAIDENGGVSRPFTVMSYPVSHVFILDYIVVGVLDLVIFEDLEDC